MDTSSIQAGLSTAKDGVMSLIKFIVNDIAVPILSAVIVGFLVFLIVSAVHNHRQGEDNSRKIFMIVGAVIVLALITSFPAWGWKLIGA
jgi:hypothetical protein